MKKKMIVGIPLSALLIYLAVRGIRLEDVADGLTAVRYRYIPPVLILILLIQVLRSLRWGVILSPIEKVDQLSLFSVTSLGFLAIVAIPARLGELARPYLISKKSNIRMTAALGTIFVERVFDSFTILIMAAFVIFSIPLPSWLTEASIFFFLIIMAILAMMVFMIVKREASFKAIAPLLNRLPDRYAHKLNRLIHHFIDGFKIITHTRALLYVMFLSGIIWLMGVLVIYILFFAFGFHLPPVAAFVLMIILIIGITIPTAPGFIGNWHFFCVLGLGLFSIPRTDAFTFAVIYHFLSIGIVIILGLIFLPFNKFPLSGLNLQLSKDQGTGNSSGNLSG
ncbi:MAG: lysylphosphatidylglycerol synthase transmembrane domain-containing protein [Syntrophales bacterium]|nr:lysylphosphatidylglycerol synthase transmembrane domain-containing protein [Syntrophales bacterium]